METENIITNIEQENKKSVWGENYKDYDLIDFFLLKEINNQFMHNEIYEINKSKLLNLKYSFFYQDSLTDALYSIKYQFMIDKDKIKDLIKLFSSYLCSTCKDCDANLIYNNEDLSLYQNDIVTKQLEIYAPIIEAIVINYKNELNVSNTAKVITKSKAS